METPTVEEELKREHDAIQRLQHNPDYRLVLQRMESEINRYREMLPYEEERLPECAAKVRALDEAYKILKGQ